jgi:hypothetical protein
MVMSRIVQMYNVQMSIRAGHPEDHTCADTELQIAGCVRLVKRVVHLRSKHNETGFVFDF